MEWSVGPVLFRHFGALREINEIVDSAMVKVLVGKMPRPADVEEGFIVWP